MKFKLDENLGPSIQSLFHEHGHDCATTREEGLGGADDPEVLKAAVAEGRILVTNDHDLGNVHVYPPEKTAGIVVLNPPGQVSMRLLRRLIIAFLEALAREDVDRKLWIVEPGRIREHQSSRWSDEDDSPS
jgi:predicted nuclease of predicted toxin-antitoxin system